MRKLTRAKDFFLFITLLTPAYARADFSAFTAKLAERARAASLLPLTAGEEVSVSFVRVDADPWHMGIVQRFRVNAPLAKLLAALDDVPGYVGIFTDLKRAELRDQSGEEFTLFTETAIPLPFVPNDRTSVRYRTWRAEGHVLYQFQLKEGNHLNAYEGVALAAADGPHHSVYWEIDLIEPGFGASRALPAKKLWVQNALGSAQSDWALKLKAEGALGKAADILGESEKRAEKMEDAVASAFAHPASFEDLLAQYKPASPSASASPKKPFSANPSTAKPKHKGPKSEPKP